ncbi:hypothetical protein HYW21_08265 [Candidatus Woesearchaeota archaeon]|nr:hypothetical protein [Candidatus Woesearchaeota archaeon]
MTIYKCPKCHRGYETKDYDILNRRCGVCSVLMIPSCYKRPVELKERISFEGERWQINQYDQDSMHGSRHAHNLETGEKLNLDNGDVYDPRIKKSTRKFSQKKLVAFKSRSRYFKTL